MNEILKKIDEMINNTKELLNEFEKNERLEVKLRTLLIVKEIIQSEQKENNSFKQYFMDLYGQGLEITNWHLNGDTEPLDNFIDSALDSESKSKTKGDVIRESNEILAKYIADHITSCGCEAYEICNKNGGDCTDVWIAYLNQPSESEENMDMLTDLTPKESARIRMLIEHQEKELDRRNRLIESLTTDRDYWEREAKKYCAQIGEIRILAAQELCNK